MLLTSTHHSPAVRGLRGGLLQAPPPRLPSHLPPAVPPGRLSPLQPNDSPALPLQNQPALCGVHVSLADTHTRVNRGAHGDADSLCRKLTSVDEQTKAQLGSCNNQCPKEVSAHIHMILMLDIDLILTSDIYKILMLDVLRYQPKSEYQIQV